MKIQKIFYVSDSTALTAKSLGKSLISQFENIYFMEYLKPYINTQKKVLDLCQEINQLQEKDGKNAIVFASMMDSKLIELMQSKLTGIVDILNPFIPVLEKMISEKSSRRVGQAHKMNNHKEYEKRIASIDFTLSTDDGLNLRYYDDADIILLGISRTGKTPTALYLALNFGLKVANYPFTSEDFPHFRLKEEHKRNKNKLFGLSISPERLASIRKERNISGSYAQADHIEQELLALKDLFVKEKIPYVDTTNRSVEEIAAFIMSKRKF